MAAELARVGIDMAGFAADIRDEAMLAIALWAAKARFGPIDLLGWVRWLWRSCRRPT